MNLTTQSILRAAFAPVLFAVLAVSVSENAAAQTVQVCAAGDSAGMNPHDSSTNPGEKNTCRNSAGGGIYTVPSPTSGFSCATCIEFSALSSSPAFFNQLCDIVYRVEGDSVDYCGPRSQCDAVGGILLSVNLGSGSSPATPTGEVCKCDAGNARIGGECVAGETAGDCEDFEEYASTEDADRTEGACRPRVAGDCTGSNEEFTAAANPADGGTCTCISNYGRNSDGICVLNASFHQACYDADFTAPIANSATAEDCRAAANNPEDIAVCAVIDPDTGSTDSNPGDFETVVGGSCSEDNPCAASSQHAYLPDALSHADRALAGQCASRAECLGRQRAPTAAGFCRLARNNADCEAISGHAGNPNTPVYEEGATNNCRAISLAECEANQIFANGVCTTCDSSSHQRPNTDRDECVECDTDQHLVSGSCVACDANEVRAQGDAACTCPHYDNTDAGTCDLIPDCTDAHHRLVDNVCMECDMDQHLVNGACVACDANEVRAEGDAACTCPHYDNTDAGTCDLIPDCTDAHHRLVDNVCTECDRDQHLVNGACVACDTNEVRAPEAAACTCPVFTDTDGSCIPFTVCDDPLDLNEVDNTCFCNSATHFEETDGSCVAHADCTDAGDNVIRNTQDNTCICADNSEGTPETACTACTGGKTSQGGAACACPADTLPFENSEGVCEASLDGTCTEEPRTFYNPVTNACECPTGQRLNADETACEAIPASSDGGSSNGAVIALVAVPVVLIGGYWLLGGFDYIDPAYGLDYSGENGNLDWRGNAGFNLQHGGLRSYASALQSNGDAVSYESGISYERDFLSLTYDAAESESEYLYDFGASAKAVFGSWTIAPGAAAEFQYLTEEADWNAEAAAGVSANWTADRWNVRARSSFSGGNDTHQIDVRREF